MQQITIYNTVEILYCFIGTDTVPYRLVFKGNHI